MATPSLHAQESTSLTTSPGSNLASPKPQPSENVPLANQVPAASANKMQSWLTGDYATGDWGSYRQKWKDDGFEFFGYYNAIVAGNPVGGISHAAAYADDFYFGLHFDLGKMGGPEGTNLEISGVNRDGRDISHQIGSQYSVMQLVGGQNLFLYDVFLEQKLFDNNLCIKVGRLSAGDDFAASPLYGYYLNNGIDGNIRSMLFDTKFSAYPFPVWGARVKVIPAKDWYFMSGAYQVSDHMFDSKPEGLDFGFRDDDGYLILNQVGWNPNFAKKPVQVTQQDGTVKTEMKGLPGHYFFGGYYSQFHYTEFGSSAISHNSYGFYLHGDQMIYQEAPGSDQGLTLFGIVAYAPQQTISIIPLQFSGGALYRGLIPDRKEDMTIFGFIHGRFSEDYANTQELMGLGDVHSETVLEAGYRIQLTPWAYFQPDLQGVITPGGTGSIPDALVVGAQFGLKF